MEKRTSTRVPFQVSARIDYKHGSFEAEITNLSTTGAMLQTDELIPLSDVIDITIFLSGASSELAMDVKATVLRHEKDGIAVSFSDVDLDSYIHLRNIVAHNSIDEEKIIRDFENAYIDNSVKD
jgi:hypothetical protein